MTTATISTLDHSLQTTNEWLGEIAEETGRDDPQRAYRILRAALHALRDRLTVEEATDLGAQLPMIVRGIYYEGWNPAKSPTKERNLESFLAHVSERLQETTDGDPKDAARAVFKIVAKHVTDGEVSHVKSNLPLDVQALWP